MKFGVRKPSIKKSVSARTKGKAKRKLKRMKSPLYGKKGVGWVRNPRKALYNKVYRKTTFSAKSGFGFFLYPFYAITKIIVALLFYIIVLYLIILYQLCVLIINGVISLVEFVVNINADDEDSAPAIPPDAE